jgi:hypothetical protein
MAFALNNKKPPINFAGAFLIISFIINLNPGNPLSFVF